MSPGCNDNNSLLSAMRKRGKTKIQGTLLAYAAYVKGHQVLPRAPEASSGDYDQRYFIAESLHNRGGTHARAM